MIADLIGYSQNDACQAKMQKGSVVTAGKLKKCNYQSHKTRHGCDVKNRRHTR